MGVYDVIIVGGGVIGCSIAYHLSLLKRCRLLIIEKSGIAGGASGSCDGILSVLSKKGGIHLELALESLSMLKGLSRELPLDIEFREIPGMVIIEDQGYVPFMEKFVSEQKRTTDLEIDFLNAKEARRFEPLLSPKIVGAVRSPQNGQANPIYLTYAFFEGACLRGAELKREEVLRIERRASDGFKVTTSIGSYESERVVLSAGAWSPLIPVTLGVKIPIKPRRGQILVTEPVERAINHTILSSRYIVAKYGVDTGGKEGLALEQTHHGSFLIGATREFVGYDRRVTSSAFERIAQTAIEAFPFLRGLRVIRAFAGLRPWTPDGLPIIDDIDGLVLACGHEGDGICLSAVTGRLVSELMVYGRASFDLYHFSLRRFSDSSALYELLTKGAEKASLNPKV
ncbi:MAG: FAD-binding oxidoreductase [Synergistetes bacterium]|nr:FAD-binding oxidoreductase [Synergistota bacterium]MDW8192344.1 FAD-binding oxidoreductase [Synergistota bacterium]